MPVESIWRSSYDLVGSRTCTGPVHDGSQVMKNWPRSTYRIPCVLLTWRGNGAGNERWGYWLNSCGIFWVHADMWWYFEFETLRMYTYWKILPPWGAVLYNRKSCTFVLYDFRSMVPCIIEGTNIVRYNVGTCIHVSFCWSLDKWKTSPPSDAMTNRYVCHHWWQGINYWQCRCGSIFPPSWSPQTPSANFHLFVFYCYFCKSWYV